MSDYIEGNFKRMDQEKAFCWFFLAELAPESWQIVELWLVQLSNTWLQTNYKKNTIPSRRCCTRNLKFWEISWLKTSTKLLYDALKDGIFQKSPLVAAKFWVWLFGCFQWNRRGPVPEFNYPNSLLEGYQECPSFNQRVKPLHELIYYEHELYIKLSWPLFLNVQFTRKVCCEHVPVSLHLLCISTKGEEWHQEDKCHLSKIMITLLIRLSLS